MENFVTLRTYDAPTEAKLHATAIEDADIPTRVVDDEIVAADPLLSQAVGGVKLQVPESEAERAAEIIADARDGSLADGDQFEAGEFEDFTEEEEEEWQEVSRGLHCPECQSESVGLDPVWM